MSWKFVFNASNMAAGTTLDEIAKIAAKAEYRFMCVNEVVYFIDTEADYYLTNLKLEDLY